MIKHVIKAGIIGSVSLLAMQTAFATDPSAACPDGTQSCTISNQHMGDSTTTAEASNVDTRSSQAGVSSASNQSGNTISGTVSPDIQTTQNATTSTGAITSTGGTSSSHGNYSDNDNRSSASNGAQTNTVSTGASTSSSGGNQMNGLGGSAINGGMSNDVSSNNGGNDYGSNTYGGNQYGANTQTTGASTSSVGTVGSNSGGNKLDNGNTVLNGSDSKSSVGDTKASIGDTKATVGDLSNGSNSGGNNLSNGSASFSGGNDISTTVKGGDQSLSGGNQDTKVNTAIGADQRNAVNASSVNDNKSGVLGSGNSDNKNTQAQTNAGNNTALHVDASDKSVSTYEDNSKYIFIPPVVPMTPPSQVAVGNIIKETTACGPLQKVIKTPIIGTRSGIIGSRKIEQGYTYDLAPYIDDNGVFMDYRRITREDGSIDLFGHQAVMFTTVVGIAGGGNLALGGGSGKGDWGQAGGGSSSSNTMLVTNIQLVQCQVGTLRPQPDVNYSENYSEKTIRQ